MTGELKETALWSLLLLIDRKFGYGNVILREIEQILILQGVDPEEPKKTLHSAIKIEDRSKFVETLMVHCVFTAKRALRTLQTKIEPYLLNFLESIKKAKSQQSLKVQKSTFASLLIKQLPMSNKCTFEPLFLATTEI